MSSTLESHRQLYAALVSGSVAEPARPSIEQAFRAVPREQFMGPGPWYLSIAGGDYVETPTADPELLYQDVLVALKKDQRLNNGQPSMHARSIGMLEVKPGQSITHIGAGTGYYSAILAEIAGEDGHVSAYEIDRDLQGAAVNNLVDWKNVSVHGDAASDAIAPSEVIYVNAGVTAPEQSWLNALNSSGRMLFPLTDNRWNGGMLLLHRLDTGRFSARFVSPVSFIPCVGARDDAEADRLGRAFAEGLGHKTRALVQDDKPDDSCVFAGSGWWLSSREVG
jgi:protein-L-isoaspartate(D-aspartate) O-methyltransferase